jgi:hypothetical protein
LTSSEGQFDLLLNINNNNKKNYFLSVSSINV